MTHDLIVQFRLFGQHAPMRPVIFMKEMLERLGDKFSPRFLLLTSELQHDFIAEATAAGAEVVTFSEGEKTSISGHYNRLMEALTDLPLPRLYISPGVQITKDHVSEALHALRYDWNNLCYGWQIAGILNDGSCPGRLLQNTCQIFAPHAPRLIGKLPKWVDSGELGAIDISFSDGSMKSVPIGGGEETVQMAQAIAFNPYATFGFDRDILPFPAHTGIGVSFDEKVARKVPVARDVYLPRLGLTPKALMQHIVLYGEQTHLRAVA